MFKPTPPPARRAGDEGAEMIRTDVFSAVAGAFALMNSENIVLRGLFARGQLDARCTSRPVVIQ